MEDANKSLRHNQGKLRWTLVHFGSLEPLVEVLMFGAKKYSPDNWKKGFDRKELLDSMARHVTALMDGEEFDSESKLHHIGHIFANAMFYSFHFVLKKDKPFESLSDSQSLLLESIQFIKLRDSRYFVMLVGQKDFHDGIGYSHFIHAFLENKEMFEKCADGVEDNSITYKKKNYDKDKNLS